MQAAFSLWEWMKNCVPSRWLRGSSQSQRTTAIPQSSRSWSTKASPPEVVVEVDLVPGFGEPGEALLDGPDPHGLRAVGCERLGSRGVVIEEKDTHGRGGPVGGEWDGPETRAANE